MVSIEEGFVPDFLKQRGWYYNGKCNICGGKKKYKYRHQQYPDYEVQFLVTDSLYHLNKKNARLYSHLTIHSISKILDTL